MAIGKPLPDQSSTFNSVYKVTLDMSGWTQTTIHVVPPLGGAIQVSASNDSGAVQSVTQGNATLAQNFVPVQATNIATNTVYSSINAAGIFTVPINAQFLRLQGVPAAAGTSVYKLLLFNSKVD